MDGRTLSARLTALALAIAGLVHPGDFIAGGALLGAGFVVATAIRRRRDERERVLDVAAWIEELTFPTDTAVEIVERLVGTSLAELRSTNRDRAFFAGMAAESERARRKRSAAARRGVEKRRMSR